MRAAVPVARRESRPILLDSIPRFLDELVQALAGSGGETAPRAPREHAEQRAELTGYSLEQVLLEYSLLRSVVLDALQGEGPLASDELAVVLHTFDMGVSEAAIHFVGLQERDLRESEARFRLLVDGVRDYAIIMLDPQGHVVSWNSGAQRIKGYDESEILGKHFSAFFPEEDVAADKPGRALATATMQGRYEDDGWRVRKDGTRFRAHVTVTALHDPEGRLRGFSKVTQDMTERKVIEERFRSLVDTVVDGVITIDGQSLIQSFNAAAERIFGYAAYEVIGRHVRMLMPEPYQSEHDQYMQNYRRTGVRRVIGIGREVVGRRKDGSTFPMDLAVSAFGSDAQRLYTGIVRDITERKRLEQELRQRALDLEAANHQKDQFIGMLGHELRNPLAAINSSVEVLKRRAGDRAIVERTQEVIGRQIHHLVRLVDDLLDLTRIRRGALTLRIERVELKRLVRQAVEVVAAQTELRQQRVLVHESSADEIWLDADPTRLTQAIANLLHNASKFSDNGTVIDVFVQLHDAEALVKVRDHGAGIAADLLPNVFDLFASGVRWVAGVQGGLGIGLQLVRTLIELHGGRVEAHSEGLGKGSTFSLRLPAPNRGARGAGTPAVQVTTTPVVAADVLVVDDNVDAATSLGELLKLIGHHVRVAHTGESAIEQAFARPPNLLLLDISLPDLDGYEIARRLRRDPRLATTCIIALSGHGQAADRELSLAAGMNGHRTKPLSLADLQPLLAAATGLDRG